MSTVVERVAQMARLAADAPGVTSLIVFGSTTTRNAGRRDEWSDIDANVFLTHDEAGRWARQTWPFLPDRDQLVLTAREGADGGVALWADGMICEFGAGGPWQVSDPDLEVLVDGGDIVLGDPPSLPEASDQVGLFVVKVLLGYGRIHRGEVISGNSLLRVHAVGALCEALRQRLAPGAARSPFDPMRRIEQVLPQIAAEIAHLQLAPARLCALGLLALAERELAPGWEEFPSAGLEAARRRLAAVT